MKSVGIQQLVIDIHDLHGGLILCEQQSEGYDYNTLVCVLVWV
jgi:hypothetical protein